MLFRQIWRWQRWGVLTKAITAAATAAQVAIVVRLLSVEAWGRVGLVMATGLFLGALTHFGVVESTMQAIARSNLSAERRKIAGAALGWRMLLTLPAALFLVAAAPRLTAYYRLPDATPFYLMALVLILQAAQGIAGAALTGIHAFAALYLIQIIFALLNLPLFAWSVWRWGESGFFAAQAAGAFLMGGSMFWYFCRREGLPAFPRRTLLFHWGTRLWRTSAAVYLARWAAVGWRRLTVMLAGIFLFPQALGHFNGALVLGGQLGIFANMLAELNLAVFARAARQNARTAAQAFVRNLTVTGRYVWGAASLLALFAGEINRLLLGGAYREVTLPTVVALAAFACAALSEIVGSGLFVALRYARGKSLIFLTQLAAALVFAFLLFWQKPVPLSGAAGMLAGAFAGLALAAVLIWRRWRTPLFGQSAGFFFLLSLPLWLLGAQESPWHWRAAVLLLGALLWWWAEAGRRRRKDDETQKGQ
jgi:O-antigen/teichoic acid export membrane protein